MQKILYVNDFGFCLEPFIGNGRAGFPRSLAPDRGLLAVGSAASL